MATSKKPTGLQIERKGNKFIFRWSKPQDYKDGQMIEWWFTDLSGHRLNNGFGVLSASVSKYTVTAPAQYKKVTFRVKGNHEQKKNDPGWSDWATKSLTLKKPALPKVSVSWDASTPNKTTFTYTATDSDAAPFSYVQFRTKWVQNYNGKPASYSWTGALTERTAKTGTIFNSTETVPTTGSYTRIVQIRAVGPAGATDYVYATHTYAKPNVPVITKADGKEIPERTMTTLALEWSLKTGAAHPVDKTTVQYKMIAPGAGMVFPTGESPDDADTPVNTGANSWSEEIPTLLNYDQCLFARIKVTHDTRDEYSDYKIAAYGKLVTPTGVTTTPEQDTHTIVVNATNASSVPDSYLACVYKNGDTEAILGIIPNGSTSVNMVVPPWTTSSGTVGVYAVVGSYTAQPADANGVVVYTIASPQMTSDTVWKGVMTAPTITAVQAEVEETATVTWNWVDDTATGAEVSWADHIDAWESTEEPETHIVDRSKASRLNVSGLEPGIMWYFRVRLITQSDNETAYGLYSDIFPLNLSSAPAIPVLEMSNPVIDPDSEAIASWVYVSGDNTPQIHATIAQYAEGVYTEILQVGADQTAVINPAELEWAVGDYQLAVKVESESGRWSEYSDPVPVTVAEPLTCSITQASLTSKTEIIDSDTFTYPYVLADMPMTVTVTGAGNAGQTILTIKRKEDFVILRPDDTELIGHADEVVCQFVYNGEAQQTITIDDVHGKLNDGATYYIEATVNDRLGRTASDRYPNSDPDDFFKVMWDGQAIMPEAQAEIVENDYARLTITKPQDWLEGDTVDIYRLTSDRPQLIAEKIAMSDDPVVYVDPYPTLGENGGYRFVYKTANEDDTIDGDSNFAWLDISTVCESEEALIDFNGERVGLGYNLKVSNSWKKDFKETKFLGGSIVGAWKRGVSREGSLDAVTVPVHDAATFRMIRRLAEHAAPCHVRSLDGSVVICNIDVDDKFGYDTAGMIQDVGLSFTRVDPTELDAMPIDDWLVTP